MGLQGTACCYLLEILADLLHPFLGRLISGGARELRDQCQRGPILGNELRCGRWHRKRRKDRAHYRGFLSRDEPIADLLDTDAVSDAKPAGIVEDQDGGSTTTARKSLQQQALGDLRIVIGRNALLNGVIVETGEPWRYSCQNNGTKQPKCNRHEFAATRCRGVCESM